jgi:PPK2 family polyphosphate:nucleotide phosphotransferase
MRVAPGSSVRLSRDYDPGYTGRVKKSDAARLLRDGVQMLADYQDKLASQNVLGLLIVLQGIDASGKDGTIKHVMSGLNPQGVAVTSFKEPSAEELDHDFLWRYGVALPGRGRIGIYNRSHYEEVLVVRVHPELLKGEHLPARTTRRIWEQRYQDINRWERYLVGNGIHIVKIMLNLSRQEQARRFLKRIEHPEKNWKFSASDIRERSYWEDYQQAFNDMLSATTSRWAPWYVVPADHKWFTRLATAAIVARKLHAMDPRYPAADPAAAEQMEQAKAELLPDLSG